MPMESLFKNMLFVSLFASMLAFLTENILKSPRTETALNEDLTLSTKGTNDATVFYNSKGVEINQSFVSQDQGVVKTFFSSWDFPSSFLGISLLSLTYILVSRWIESGHPPLSSLYESLLFLLWNFVTIYFLLWSEVWSNIFSPLSSPENTLIKSSVSNWSFSNTRRTIGFVVSSTALFIYTFAEWRLPDNMREIKSLIPALQSNWLLMHVSIMIVSYASLFVGCILAITYLVFDFSHEIKVKRAGTRTAPSSSEKDSALAFWGDSLPNPLSVSTRTNSSRASVNEIENLPVDTFAESGAFSGELVVPESSTNLDMISYKLLSFGFPLLTLGILSGAIWANEAWGSYWSWDPKETWAFVTWLVFAFYLHTRVQYGWNGRKSAFVASFGFFIVWVCYLGVNLLGKGLHSYGWISS